MFLAIEKNFEQQKEKWKEKWKLEGKLEGIALAIKKMYTSGYDIKKIAEILEESEETVKKVVESDKE